MHKTMKVLNRYFAFTLISCLSFHAIAETSECPKELNIELRLLHSKKLGNVCDYYRANTPLLIVNTASHCGYTEQFKDLEALYQKYKDQGFVILGFPSNSFKQEEKSEAATARVCYENYGVTFPMFEHVAVTGANANPIFKYLTEHSAAPEWNFNKYLLINKHVEHFDSKTKPMDSVLSEKIKFSF